MNEKSDDLNPTSREKELTKAEQRLADALGAVLAKWWAVDGQAMILDCASPVPHREPPRGDAPLDRER